MLKRFTDTFEVHLCRRGVWTVQRVGLTAPLARELGESEFRRSSVDGLRIVPLRSSRVTGAVTQDLMVQSHRPAPPAAPAIPTTHEVPPGALADTRLRPPAPPHLHPLVHVATP